MTEFNRLGRRDVIAAAGAALAAGLAGDAAHAPAAAQAVSANDIVRNEYWAKKGEVSLYLFRKRVGAPAPGEAAAAGPVLRARLVQLRRARASISRCRARANTRCMNVFARFGFDVWTMDHEGYGKSSRTAGNSDIASGVEDLKAATEVVAKETGRAKMHFFGTSSGAIRAAAFAQARPERVDRLVLSAFTYKGDRLAHAEASAPSGSTTTAPTTRRLRDRAMIRSIFTRDGLASSYDPAVAEAHRRRRR